MEIIAEHKDQFTTHIKLIIDSEPVSGLYLHRREMRIGIARVTMGGIGGVGTKEEHRMKGYARRVMEYTVQYAYENGYDVSLLFGIRNFYPKWGFATSLGNHKMTITTKAAQQTSSSYPVRPFQLGDMPAILEIYNKNNATRTCSIVRPPFPEDRFPKGTRFFCDVHLFVVTNSDGEIIGYAGVDEALRDRNTGERTKIEGEVMVCEVGAKRDEAFSAILAELGSIAEREGVENIDVFLPPDDPFAIYCRRYGYSMQTNFSSDGGAMMRIINLYELFRKIRPELKRRVQCYSREYPVGSLLIRTDIGDLTIRISDDVEVINRAESADGVLELPQWALLQMLIGYRSTEDVINDKRVRTKGEVIPIAESLFPTHQAYVWRADWF